MNIYDISQKAGVSIATVSRVLNGSEKVSEKTRKKVLAVMEENSYTPNAFARSLGLNSMHTVGILCSDSSDVYHKTGNLLSGARASQEFLCIHALLHRV
ncbi:MAG: LacI family DNA-binding transcriptional regulator [Mediterraneibacter gnavus]